MGLIKETIIPRDNFNQIALSQLFSVLSSTGRRLIEVLENEWEIRDDGFLFYEVAKRKEKTFGCIKESIYLDFPEILKKIIKVKEFFKDRTTAYVSNLSNIALKEFTGFKSLHLLRSGYAQYFTLKLEQGEKLPHIKQLLCHSGAGSANRYNYLKFETIEEKKEEEQKEAQKEKEMFTCEDCKVTIRLSNRDRHMSGKKHISKSSRNNK